MCTSSLTEVLPTIPPTVLMPCYLCTMWICSRFHDHESTVVIVNHVALFLGFLQLLRNEHRLRYHHWRLTWCSMERRLMLIDLVSYSCGEEDTCLGPQATLHRYRILIRRYRYGDTVIRHFPKTRIRRYSKYINIPKIRIHLLRTFFTLAEQSTNKNGKT